MAPSQDIVAKLWQLCGILREAGISYPEYVTELTYLIFLKMAQETGTEKDLPKGFRWNDLSKRTGSEQFAFYKQQLEHLSTAKSEHVRKVFSEAKTFLTQPKHLGLLVVAFDEIKWYEVREESALADLYEGLLEKNSTESKAGAGQYFTTRPLVETIVECVKPHAGEIIQDPACGTAGFLIAADRYIKRNSAFTLDKEEIQFQRDKAFWGVELVAQTHKLALMNAMLHGIWNSILKGDALADAGEKLPLADLILTNPPFGTRPGAGLPDRKFPIPTSNKQLAFLQHIYLGLKPGGRAAVVLPDLQGKAARQILGTLMEKCDLHTVLRLPPGIFYAQNVRTNVCFFTRGKTDTGNTKQVWIYDLRSNLPTFNKSNPLTRAHFAEFEKAFGSDPYGKSKREDQGEQGRFRCFSREYIRDNSDSLNITWLNEYGEDESIQTSSPDIIAKRIETKLRFVLKELGALTREVTSRR